MDDEESLDGVRDPDPTPPSREDFVGMMDDFLDNYEILGGKMKTKLEGDSGVEKLDTLRRAMGRDERVNLHDDESEEEVLIIDVDKKILWDCETILSQCHSSAVSLHHLSLTATYSNLENHPRLIRARESKPISRIRLDHRTGLPTSNDQGSKMSKTTTVDKPRMYDRNRVLAYSNALLALHATMTRSRNEPKEEKKSRKLAVKRERQARRVEKKVTKEQFSVEFERQRKALINDGKNKMRKL